MKFKKGSLIDGEICFHKFRGSELVSEFFENRFSKSKGVLVYFDPDVDGLFSGYLACRALVGCGIPFSWYINSRREHGFMLPLDKVRGKDLLCVDFKMTFDDIKMLVDAGCNVLSIDHHINGDNFIDYSNNGCRGIVINNQYGFEPDSGRYLSGAGVVFEAFRGYLGESFDTSENRALVGLTLLSDIRNIENINARLYLQILYTHKYKGYIGYLLDHTLGDIDYSFGVPRIDRNFADFTFSPIINSCLRFNKQDDVVKFILGSGKLDKGYHKKQKELVLKMKECSRVFTLKHIHFVMIDMSSFIGTDEAEYISSFVGLLASQFLDGKRSVIAYLVNGRQVGRASFRGRVNGADYLHPLEEYINGVGHESAFGIKAFSPSKELFKKIDDICGKVEEGIDTTPKYVECSNLSMLASNKGYDMGVENIFCLSQNRSYIRYLGNNVKVRRSGAKYKEYNIDGISVMCFDDSLDPRKDLIMPIMDRAVLCFYLNKKLEG